MPDPETAFRCSKCGHEFTTVYRKTTCLDCGAELLNIWTGRPVSDGDEPDADYVTSLKHPKLVVPFGTDNPWFTRLFQDKSYGHIPKRAPDALTKYSPDPEEKIFSAVVCLHGIGKTGVLLATTKWLRWAEYGLVGRLGFRSEDYWGYDTPIETEGNLPINNVLRLGDGTQFQMTKMKANTFSRHYRCVQQALIWEADHERSAPQPVQATGGGLGVELEKLAGLYSQGLLTEDEFTDAKRRLLHG